MIAPLRRTVAALVLALPLAVAVALPSTAATEPSPAPSDDLASFGIAPAGPDRPDGRPYLAVTAPPGSVVYEHVALLNQDAEPVTLEVYGADVVMADGGLTVRAATDPDTDAGAWVSVGDLGAVQVPAQGTDGAGYTVVPLTITIPQDAEPGDHVAGLVAALVTRSEAGDQGPAIQLEQRVAARVYVQVDGEIAPGLAVEEVTASWAPDGLLGSGSVRVGWTLRNTGNVRIAVESGTTVAGPFGSFTREADAGRVEELLPGGTARLHATVDGVVALGRARVSVTAQASAPVTGGDPGLAAVTASTHVWAVPWGALALVALLLALAVATVLRRRSGRATPAEQPAPASSADPVHDPVAVGR